jgi:hypothetical protein
MCTRRVPEIIPRMGKAVRPNVPRTPHRCGRPGDALRIAPVRQVISAPVTVAREVTDDVASTLRGPDAVLYLGGVVDLAALGSVEWPVAAVAGVGFAIASGIRGLIRPR